MPAIESTHHLINQETLKYFRSDACLLNFAREQIVDTEAVAAALDNEDLGRYITDFPHPLLRGRKDCILMPHIGASTAEAEEIAPLWAPINFVPSWSTAIFATP